MANLFDYINWREDISFKVSSLNEIDNLILSEIAYMDYENIVSSFPSTDLISFKQATNTLFNVVKKEDIVLGLIVPNDIIELADEMKDTTRFSKVMMSNYINSVDSNDCHQFAAMCFHLSKDKIYIAFRGTDDTLIGWQEDLDMVCKFPVPSQKLAVKYVNQIAELFPDAKLYIGGHSKGGNLATYAAIYCKEEVKKKIIQVYNNDGPGFNKGFINLDRYNLIKDKITRIIPKESIIGVIFDDYSGNTIIVDSFVKGLYQHDAFTWEIYANRFVKVKELSDNSIKLDMAITKMLERMDHNERKAFASNVFEFITILNKNTLIECQKDVFGLLKYIKTLNPKNRKLFMELIYNLIKFKQI